MKIKYLDLNIWNGGRLFDNLLNFLKKENPDILSLQEVYHGTNPALEKRYRSVTEINKLLHFPYISFAPTFKDISEGINSTQGNAIFSKFPIITENSFFYDTQSHELDHNKGKNDDWIHMARNLQHVKIDLGHLILDVFNTHGIWDIHGEDNPRRIKMSEIIIDKIKDKKNVILSGDFNTKEETQTISNIEKYLTNVFKGELKSTFNLEHKKEDGFKTAVVDMIFVSHTIKVIEHYMPQVNVSDHMPLVCILEIN